MNAPHVIAMDRLAEELKKSISETNRKCRFDRQRFIESEIVELRPDFNEAKELLDALQTGLALKVGPYGDELPVDVEHYFKRLREALNEADELYLLKQYDPRDQYTGDEEPYGE